MIEIHDSLSDECSDVTLSSKTAHSSSSAGGSFFQCSAGDTKYTTSNIKDFLQ